MTETGRPEDQFRLLFEVVPNGMIVIDKVGVIIFANTQVEKLFGYSRGELIGQPVEVLIPERFRAAHPGLRKEFSTDPQPRPMGAGRDLYGRGKSGNEFPLEIGLNPLHSGDRFLVIASVIDITERKRNQEHIEFIMRELCHRSKNLLMVVLAIANQTVRRAISFSEFQKSFESRLMALARSHDLLIERRWTGATIEALVSAQMKPFMEELRPRVDVAGPPITLAPEAAQNIGIALYELATNALKFGALSSSNGQVIIRWELDVEHKPPRFKLSWQERGGPRVDPPSHEGLGRKLLSHVGKGAEDGNTLVFAPEGLTWRLECDEQLVLQH